MLATGTPKAPTCRRRKPRSPATRNQTTRVSAAPRCIASDGLLGEPRQAAKYFASTTLEPSCPVTLAQASTIVDVALKKARDSNLAPLTVAVLDAGGHLVAFKREDKSGILRFDIAFGKAWGALGMGFGSRTLASRAAKTPQFFTMLAAASGGRMVTNPGGVLIRDGGGNIVGACGISGDTSDKDEMCAIAGIEAAGLRPIRARIDFTLASGSAAASG